MIRIKKYILLLFALILTTVWANANAGWFTDSYYEQGYDTGMDYGYDISPCSRNKPKNYSYFLKAIMTKEGDWFGSAGSSVTHSVVLGSYFRVELGTEYSINGDKVSRVDFDDFSQGFEKGEILGKAKCDIK